MPDEHESCNKYDRLSHTSALGELFIADESKKAQEEIQKSCVFRNGKAGEGIDETARGGSLGSRGLVLTHKAGLIAAGGNR